MSRVYYNENDPHAAQWLRNLMALGAISHGVVDERSILDVTPNDLRGFTRCHFFAGIGVWDYALGLARWPLDRPVWTGSCPCQPFSAAGVGDGFDDERHLWPAWHWLISQCRPERVYGEQVASPLGLSWFDLVRADFQGEGFSGWGGDICAASVGAPHIRQRLFFVADSAGARFSRTLPNAEGEAWDETRLRLPRPQRGPRLMADTELLGRDTRIAGDGRRQIGAGSEHRQVDDRRRFIGLVADTEGERRLRGTNDEDGGRRELASGRRRAIGLLEYAEGDGRIERRSEPSERRSVVGRSPVLLGVAERARREGHLGYVLDGDEPGWLDAITGGPIAEAGAAMRPGPTNGFWRDPDWLFCTDGKWRPVEPGSFPLVDGSTFRVGSGGTYEGRSRVKMLKGYGNAIVGPLAAAFVYLTQ